MNKQFEAGKTYKLSDNDLVLAQLTMAVEFKGEAGVFTVHEVDVNLAYSDDVTSPMTAARFNVPHWMCDNCTEVADASGATE